MQIYKYFGKIFFFLTQEKRKKIWAFLEHYLGGLFLRIDDHHMFLLGGGLAFSIFICIIPITLIVFSVLGNVLDSASVEEQISNFIATFIPYPKYAEYTTKIIMKRVPEVIEYKNFAAWVGGIGLLFASSGLFSGMRTVLNKIFGVSEDKNLLIGKLRDLSMVFLLMIFLLLTTLILPILNVLNIIVEKIDLLDFIQISELMDTLFSIGSIIIVFVLFWVFYTVIPYDKLRRSVPVVSALWATIFWEFARRIFGYYLIHFANLNKVYGTYAVIVVVAFWIYYSSILFILGAEIGQLYRERKYKLDARTKLPLL